MPSVGAEQTGQADGLEACTEDCESAEASAAFGVAAPSASSFPAGGTTRLAAALGAEAIENLVLDENRCTSLQRQGNRVAGSSLDDLHVTT